MIFVGAGGHALELVSVFLPSATEAKLALFDDVTPELPSLFRGCFPILRSLDEARAWLARDPAFCVAVGKPARRRRLFEQFVEAGGSPRTVVASSAIIGDYETTIAPGANIMHQVFVSDDVRIGQGCLLNRACGIHHGCRIGDFCEIGPAANLLGGVTLGDDVFVGAGATILPGCQIGSRAVVGAGAVVTKNISALTVVAGVPAREIQCRPPMNKLSAS